MCVCVCVRPLLKATRFVLLILCFDFSFLTARAGDWISHDVFLSSENSEAWGGRVCSVSWPGFSLCVFCLLPGPLWVSLQTLCSLRSHTECPQ